MSFFCSDIEFYKMGKNFQLTQEKFPVMQWIS